MISKNQRESLGGGVSVEASTHRLQRPLVFATDNSLCHKAKPRNKVIWLLIGDDVIRGICESGMAVIDYYDISDINALMEIKNLIL